MHQRTWNALALAMSSVVAICLTRGSGAAEIAQEALSGCPLPHGTLNLAERGSPQAMKVGGHLFLFEKQKVVMSPWDQDDRRPKSSDDFVMRIRREKTGDLMYSPLAAGTFVAASGKIRDLGSHFLYEFSGKDLEKPTAVWGAEERDSSGKGTAGAVEHVKQGHCYLLETVGKKYALVRLLAKEGRTATLQWVYQPNGGTQFDIPKGETSPLPQSADSISESRAAETPTPIGRSGPKIMLPKIDPLVVAQLEKAISAHLANRQVLVGKLIDVARDPSIGNHEKVMAIKALGKMRAVEAATDLAARIAIVDPFSLSRSDTIDEGYPCAFALAQIGKPGSLASLDEIGKADSPDGEYSMKMRLFCYVVVKVEGERIARILLTDKSQDAMGKKEKKNYQTAIELIEQVKGW